ncbi:hypothetical protein JHD50_07220 [Sulfurimonas sp. MAG313]|nr:lipopolysaccharide kinase InaA family protein [Sulfurimonas sp. MAG313]MDF1881094.1 hypothetical protein [Sulfurimonas sp. MAG313]
MAIKYKLHPSYPQLEKELFNIKEVFSKDNEIIHKARNVLKIIPLHNIDTVVKAFRIPNAINQFAYAYIRKSKAYKSYFNALKLQELQVKTPSPIGFIEFYTNGFFKESYFLSEKFDYELTMADIRDTPPIDKVSILKAFARFTYDIHQKGVWHVDYSGGNVLINRQNKTYNFSLVDINRMEFKDIKGYEGLENFNKFWFNEHDLKTIAKEYSVVASLNEDKAIVEIILHDAKLKTHVLRRRKLKSFFTGK